MPVTEYLSPLKARCEAADRALKGFFVALHIRQDKTACVHCSTTREDTMDSMIAPMCSQLKEGEEIVVYTPAMRCLGRYGRKQSNES